MSRSLGGTSFTSRPPMKISPPEASSRPAIMRSVVLLPQPDGPTSTTNSLLGMSRLMLRTASTSSKRLTTLRNATSAISSALGGAGGEPGDVVVHQERIDDERRRRGHQGTRHQHAPLVDVGTDQAGDGAHREHLLV